jgi:oxygen-independent coproporphyrinogen-3 oxidase
LIWGRPSTAFHRRGREPVLAAGVVAAGDLRRGSCWNQLRDHAEANPGTFEKDRFRAFRQAGVTRLSVGVQSFDDAHLRAGPRARQRRPSPPWKGCSPRLSIST